MATIAKTTGDTFPKLPLPEAGTTQAVCCAVWDLGLQKATYMGEEKIQHKIIIAWEIAQKIDAPESEYRGKPYMLNKKYTLSLGDKANLRKDLESWRGKAFSSDQLTNGFDVEILYGVNCLIGIAHQPDRNDASKVYANVTSILPPVKGMEKLLPLRTREEPPPKWVIEKQAQAIKVVDETNDPFPALGGAFEEAAPDVGDGENLPY